MRFLSTNPTGQASVDVEPLAIAKLLKKVRTGGTGNWGDIVQPPNTTTSDADLKILVKFVLSLK